MAKKRTRAPGSANVAVPHGVEHQVVNLLKGIGDSGLIQHAIQLVSKSRGDFSFGGLSTLAVDPRAYSCAGAFRADYAVASMFSKFDPGNRAESEARRDRALGKFFEAEELCAETNRRLLKPDRDTFHCGISMHSVIFTARQKILRLLGASPNLDDAALGFGFGPGASTRLNRTESDAWYKFQGIPETTSSNAVFADAIFSHLPLWREGVALHSKDGALYKEVNHNRVTTVPKNARIDRVIAIEPDLNMFVQKGFGRLIRLALRRAGIDLNSQTLNQDMAFIGSITGDLATIDLSMASDTVSRQLIHELLPPDWVLALEQCRTPYGLLPSGDLVYYQKFSSMGNGYTFELESLIFWALSIAVLELINEKDRRLAVYGDDIVIASAAAGPLMDVLRYCGFKPNMDKTFTEGPFRESCGKHYFNGTDVTPFYVRRPIKRLSDLFLLHNNIVRWARQDGYYDAGVDGNIRKAVLGLREMAPPSFRRPALPDGPYGDGAFIGSFDEATPQRAPKGYEGWVARVLIESPVYSRKGGHSMLLKSLFYREKRATGAPLDADPVHVFHGRTRARITKILVTQWDDQNLWC